MLRFDNADQLQQELAERVQRLDAQVMSILRRAGEKAVAQARSKAEIAGRDWTDRTGNLRSSIGYGIIVDGWMRHSAGFLPGQKTKVEAGQRQGKTYLKSLASRYPKGYVLIVVAGRNYASFVADRGYDVLDSARLVSDAEIEKRINKLFAV